MSEAYTEHDLVDRLAEHESEGLWPTDSEGEREQWRKLVREELMPAIRSYADRIRSEARAGMREACAKQANNIADAYNVELPDGDLVGQAAASRIAEKIRKLPDLAADEAIERIKAESYEKGMQAGAKDEALLQYIFDEPGPIKDGIERIKAEAERKGRLAAFNEAERMGMKFASLSGKETEHD